MLGLAVLAPAGAFGCAVCMGDPAAPMTAGMNMAIWALLGVTWTVLSGFVAFFLHLRKRARRPMAGATQVDTAWRDGLRSERNG
ncbi:MAG: hypothetical protein HY304_02575 [candidate division Zixibacteria bacterium]|nr:hypothetical protein [candidate division Zixibacteria bacterium]